MYLQHEIEDSLWAVSDALAATPSIDEHIEILAPIAKSFGAKIRKGYRSSKHWEVEGFYDPNREDILIRIGCGDVQQEHDLTHTLGTFIFTVNCTLQHELIHKYQWMFRDPEIHGVRAYSTGRLDRLGKMQKYLGNFDEIETQAHDLAMEIRYYYPSTNPQALLRHYFAEKDLVLPTLDNYMKVFLCDTSHPAMKRLFTKLFNWLPKVEITKPITYSRGSACQDSK